jgi:hypothetical protein
MLTVSAEIARHSTVTGGDGHMYYRAWREHHASHEARVTPLPWRSALHQIGDTMNPPASPSSHAVSATTKTRILKPQAELFEYFIPIELPRILRGYGPVPAVVSTSDQSGPWDVPGSTRTVHLADRNTAREQVTDCEPSHYFAYRVGEFSNLIAHLADEARGQWWFTKAGQDATDVVWRYSFIARSSAAQLILLPVVKLAWRGYMRAGMGAFSDLAEAEVGVR